MLAIDAQKLSKRYYLGQPATGNDGSALRRVLDYPRRNLRRLRERMRNEHDDMRTFYALRDLSFGVERGEVLGVIGHNGAGKSTLLKILSRIAEPTGGYATIRGRVASLLEVGTGFHPELSGRENIYLNGTILGMQQREVTAKFGEIVAFSGVADHIDTPVKFYSSGMKVRLAFAVAAHLEPDILLIDEVLAVGDLAFQEKCLGKMDSVSRSGRTVLFVSHNMGAVEGLCSRGLLLGSGQKQYDGPVAEAIRRYRALGLTDEHRVLSAREDRHGEGGIRFTELRINGGAEVAVGKPLTLTLYFEAATAMPGVYIGIVWCRNFREPILRLDNEHQGVRLDARGGLNRLDIELPRLDLLPGQYFVDLEARTATTLHDRLINAAVLTVADQDLYGSGNVLNTREHGVAAPPRSSWQLESIS